MKGQNDGSINESNISEAYNNCEYQYLNECQQEFVKQLNSQVKEDTVIYAEKVGGRGYKPDVKFDIIDDNVNVSVKKGSGNSVHQEKTTYFIKYCMTELDMTPVEKESLLLYLYGDGTLDGDSLPVERLTNEELIQCYQDEINIVQGFLNRNKRNLIERFLIYGRKGRNDNVRANYLYHGTASAGIWCPFDDDSVDCIVDLISKGDPALAIGPLTMQVWNRNPEAKPNLEDRRHSVQVKWPSCKSDVIKINEAYFSRKAEIESFSTRLTGDNSQGFRNQTNISEELDGSRFKELSTNLKAMIKVMFPTVANTDLIQVEKVTKNSLKPRWSICVRGVKKYLSVFMGGGNAVHQEKITGFIQFAKRELAMSGTEEISLLKVLYGDGTTNGNSSAEERLNDSAIKETYSYEISVVNQFLDRNKREIIERALIYGKEGKQENVKSDFLYYGTVHNGRCLPYPEIIESLIQYDNASSALLPLGLITMQVWNRNLDAKLNLEERRHSVQFKWGSMKRTLNKIYEELEMNKKGKYEGDWEEFELVSKLNRNKNINSEIWKIISNELDINNLDDVYAVKCSNTKYSKLVQRNVLPKADVFLVKANFSHQFILDNNYWIDEDLIKNHKFQPIEMSGISCKRPNSKSFTYCKLSINAFANLFSNVLGVGISFFVNEQDLYLNSEILKAWGVTSEELYSFLNHNTQLNMAYDIGSLSFCKAVKEYCIAKTKRIVIETEEIREAIFNGRGVFEEPFSANFIYAGGKINKSFIPKFNITTGSGRHKGTFTIVFKPT